MTNATGPNLKIAGEAEEMAAFDALHDDIRVFLMGATLKWSAIDVLAAYNASQDSDPIGHIIAELRRQDPQPGSRVIAEYKHGRAR